MQGCQLRLSKLFDPVDRISAVFLSRVKIDRSSERVEWRLLEEIDLMSAALQRINARNSIRKSYLELGAPVSTTSAFAAATAAASVAAAPVAAFLLPLCVIRKCSTLLAQVTVTAEVLSQMWSRAVGTPDAAKIAAAREAVNIAPPAEVLKQQRQLQGHSSLITALQPKADGAYDQVDTWPCQSFNSTAAC